MKMKLDDFLAHYASEYYDPVKAHEYYERTKHLKGRRSASKLSSEGKEIWNYTKNQISDAKKEQLKDAQEAYKEQIESAREKSKESLSRISEMLKRFRESMSKDTQNDKKRISNRMNAKIKAIQDQKIPDGISKEEKAKLIAERKKKIADIRGDASEEREGTSEDYKDAIASSNEDSSKKKKAVKEELKTAISAAKEAYKQAKKDISQSYEDIYQAEYDKIKAENPFVAKAKKGSKGTSSKGKRGRKKKTNK